MTMAEGPARLSRLSNAQAVLRPTPRATACLAVVSHPADTKALRISAIFEACLALAFLPRRIAQAHKMQLNCFHSRSTKGGLSENCLGIPSTSFLVLAPGKQTQTDHAACEERKCGWQWRHFDVTCDSEGVYNGPKEARTNEAHYQL